MDKDRSLDRRHLSRRGKRSKPLSQPHLGPLADHIRDHYRRLRPKAYRDLEESGRLEAFRENLVQWRV